MTVLRSELGKTAFVSSACFLILVIAFLARTSGIHIDENNYLSLALNAPYGDSASTGKPFLFYFSNYLLIHSIGFGLGPLRPISLQLFYIAFFSASLAWAAVSVARKESLSELFPRVLLLLISPIALLNSTSLMMESAALPLLSLTMACIVRSSPERASRKSLVVSSALATAVKSTTIPALLLLAWGFRGRLESRARLIPIGIASGLALNQVVLWGIHRQAGPVYGGLGELLTPQSLLDRSLTRTESYVAMWLFFAGMAFALVAAFRPSHALKSREFRILTVGSLAGVVLFQLVSVFPFARYCYPVIWAALLGVFLISELKSRALVCCLIALQTFQAVPLFAHSIDRFKLWPYLVTRELIDSGGTIFTGFPIYGMTAWQLARDKSPCLWINSENGEKNEGIDQFAKSTFPTATIISSRTFEIASNGSCSLSNTVRFSREHVDGPNAGCTTGCRPCRFQEVHYFSVKEGWVRNQACWPLR